MGDGVRPPREKAVAFGTQGSLIGILTPAVNAESDGAGPAVVFLNSGIIHRVGANRLYVDMARMLARRGFISLRFDLSGIGDSDARREVPPLVDQVRRDVEEALEYLRSSWHVNRFVLIGLCSGAHDALWATRRDSRVVGVVMIDLPGPFRNWRHYLHHYGRRAFRAESWKNALRGQNHYLERIGDHVRRAWREHRNKAIGRNSRNLQKKAQEHVSETDGDELGRRSGSTREAMGEAIDAILARGVKLLFVFTLGIEDHYNHRSQFAHTFPRAAAHPSLALEFFPKADHMFSHERDRQQLFDAVVRWSTQLTIPEAPAAEPAVAPRW